MTHLAGVDGESQERILVVRARRALFRASRPGEVKRRDNGLLLRRFFAALSGDRGELEIDQAEAPVTLAVGDIAHFRVVMPHAVFLEFGEEFLAALRVEPVDTGAAVRRHQHQLFRIGRDYPGDEAAPCLLEVAEDLHLVGEALLGVGTMEGLPNASIKTDLDRGALGILDGEHGIGGKVKSGKVGKWKGR